MEIGNIMEELVEESKISPYFVFYFNGTISVRGLAWFRFDHSFLEPGRLAEGEPVLYILLTPILKGVLFQFSFYYYLKALKVPAAVWSRNNRQTLISHAWHPAWYIRKKAPNLLLHSNKCVCHFVDQNPVQILQSLIEQQLPNDKTYQKKQSKKSHLCF